MWVTNNNGTGSMLKSYRSAEEPHDADAGSGGPNPVDVHVGGRVRFRRMLLGMNQEKLAEKLGLTYQQIQDYEKGTNRIGASPLFDIAHVLGITAQFFYEEAPSTAPPHFDDGDYAEKPTEPAIIEFLHSLDGLELNRAFGRIAHAKTRRAIVELVRNLANPCSSPASSSTAKNPSCGRRTSTTALVETSQPTTIGSRKLEAQFDHVDSCPVAPAAPHGR